VRRADRWVGSIEVRVEGEKWTQLDQIRISYAPIGLIPPFNRAGLFLPVVSPLFLIRWEFVLPIVSRFVSVCSDKNLNR
jgi:hypothetical protein